MHVLGVDIGFGFTKATNGSDMLIFKSLFGDAADIQFWADFGESSPTDHIHVTIDGNSYFVGDLAEQQSSVLHFTLDQERLLSDYVKILSLTAAGMLQQDDSSINVPINLVSGLPIGYFRDNHNRFNEMLTGRHTITYHSSDGKEKIRTIHINKVRMLPQPMGSILNLLMNDHGKIGDQELAKQKIGVVDIGFRTTDFAILDRLRYINRGSKTIDTGISKGFSVIANKLREKSSVNVELFRLYRAAETGTITMRGHGFSFPKIRDQVYSQLARSIADEIDRLWASDWDIEAIFLSGGGTRELASYLQPMITGNVIPVDPGQDARLNNVKGYLKYGRYIWGDDDVKAESMPRKNEDETVETIKEDELSQTQ
ncbi:MAG: ParM/StbA family protein [Desulfobacterales bacterium]|nr:ParM/StbA family protein [Desulfobacterales bacterium]